jgi:lipid II:glycine glycyltransferase (peptidoglycan interpeptide bridge formation enzyme)
LAGPAWTVAAPPEIVRIPHIVHILDLEGGFEYVWSKRFKKKTRTAVRKAEQAGLVVECDTTGRLMPIFFDLYLRWIERRARESGMPLRMARWLAQREEPLRKYQLVAEHLGDACRVWVAWLDGQPAAASIELFQGIHVTSWRATSDKELAGPAHANDLIQKLTIEDACRAGCRYYHMGESGGVRSLMHFKERFGAEPRQYLEYRLERVPITYIGDRLYAARRRASAHLAQLVVRVRERTP